MQVRCDKCKQTFEVDENNIDTNLEFMQCPLCSSITKNPFKKL